MPSQSTILIATDFFLRFSTRFSDMTSLFYLSLIDGSRVKVMFAVFVEKGLLDELLIYFIENCYKYITLGRQNIFKH